MTYLAGQCNCPECEFSDVLIRRHDRKWTRDRCPACRSRLATVKVWWPVSDPRAIAFAATRDAEREVKRLERRKVMN